MLTIIVRKENTIKKECDTVGKMVKCFVLFFFFCFVFVFVLFLTEKNTSFSKAEF